MMRFRLKTHLWVEALRRRAEMQMAFVVIEQKGDPDAGDVVLICQNFDGESVVYRPQTQMDGTRAWAPLKGLTPLDLREKLARFKESDPDLWIVNIEDRAGRHFLEEPVLDA